MVSGSDQIAEVDPRRVSGWLLTTKCVCVCEWVSLWECVSVSGRFPKAQITGLRLEQRRDTVTQMIVISADGGKCQDSDRTHWQCRNELLTENSKPSYRRLRESVFVQRMKQTTVLSTPDKIDTSIHPSQTSSHPLSSALAACSQVISVLAGQTGNLNHSESSPLFQLSMCVPSTLLSFFFFIYLF